MNKLKILTYVLLGISFAGCNGLGKMAKNYSKVTHEVTPNPLEMHGDSVAINIKGTYPPKYFAKKVDVSVTPLMKTATAEHPFDSIVNVGEKSQTAGNKINSKEGGSYTYSDKIAYTPDMREADVMVRSTGVKGKTRKELGSIKVADGTIVTPLLVMSDEKPIIGKDNFQRITPANYDGTIYFLINTHNVNPNFRHRESNLNNRSEFSALDSAMKALTVAPYAVKGVTINGYASPDGTEKFNTDLAQNRSKSAAKYLAGQLSKHVNQGVKSARDRVKISPDSSMFSLSSTHEDWTGFQRLMSQSDMAQKDMILRIVESNTDFEAREAEIKKMGKAYTEIADEILPKLRRSEVTINAEKTGRSDEEISRLAKSAPDSLNEEEILYAATLTEDMNEKLEIYRSAERIYPQDWRTSNNVGYILFMNGDMDGAMAAFEKADQLSADNGVVKNNIGAVYSRRGDRTNAASNYAAAENAGPEVAQNQGILEIRNGDYQAAVNHYGNTNSFNAALAKLLAGDKEGAMTTIQASPDSDSAKGHYLMAIISARNNDANGVVTHLRSSIEKDASMKSQAASDREFIKWFNDSSFTAVVQ